jgi:hypothetical protein
MPATCTAHPILSELVAICTSLPISRLHVVLFEVRFSTFCRNRAARLWMRIPDLYT